MENRRKRIIWLDVVRTLAIISVTFNHALSRSFAVPKDTLAEFQSIPHVVSAVKALLYVFSRGGVPWFLMITAVLLLPRDYKDERRTKDFLRRNWFPLFITSEIWLAIIFFYLMMFGERSDVSGIGQMVAAFIQNQLFINQTTVTSMWYLPMILTVYLMIPVFSVALKEIDEKYIILLMVIAAVVGMIIPNINTVLSGFGIDYQMESAITITDLFSIYCIYLFCGYYIGKGILNKFSDTVIVIIAASSFLLTSIFQYWTYSTEIDYFVRYADIGVLIFSAFVFEILRRKGDGIKIGKKWCTGISKMAFAIYFVHSCIMHAMNVGMSKLPFSINYLSKFLILELVAVSLSIAIISLLSHVPVFKKHLFLIKD